MDRMTTSQTPPQTATHPRRGGGWLLEDTAPQAILAPEGLSDEHRLIGRTTRDFIVHEALPALDELEQKNWALARTLVARCGELGLLGTDVPERFGGLALDKAASIVVGEAVGACASFATTFGAQTGLTVMPLVCFGTEAQQQQYLPRVVTGELVGAYCLSESGSGSDALGARAKATRQPDGSWVLNGEKMWITNGGFADVFTVFAKVDGEHFTAFLVERAFPGVASGKEEHKMGLLGSSTTPVVLADARVPAGNLLGEIGRGHKIAFNVLNYGRLKLAAMCSGGAKAVIGEAAAYAAGRRQFGQPISAFGAIRHKLAEMAIREYAVESALYRTTGLIDAALDGASDGRALAATLEEFAVEASLLKIAGSEMIDFVVDENVQIHGGNGFVRDYPAERHYRDARVDRIFEGTNEINRLLVPSLLLKRAATSALPLLAAARGGREDPTRPAGAAPADDDRPLAIARRTAAAMKHTALLVLGLAVETYGEDLPQEQEVLMLASDVVMETFLADSAVLRAERAAALAAPQAVLHADAAAVQAHDGGLRATMAARQLISAVTEGDARRAALAAFERTLAVEPVNTVAARRRIAGAIVEQQRYTFE
jgi:alkylation response protein AidB-like acyl-CoA dehydrogenase